MRDRIQLVAVLVAGITVASTLAMAQRVAGSLPLPDVYLVTIDTLRADHVRCYGDDHIQTPAIDSLARDGVRFAHAFTPSPITNTSHTSILTGLLPSVHGVTDFGIPLEKTYPTWAELLKQEGYETAAFLGAVILDAHTLAPGLDRGFDFYDNFPADSPKSRHWGRVERRGADVVNRAEAWMGAHAGKPRFVWVHLYDPHDPYEPPPPYSQIYKDHLYDGEIAYSDAALGHLLRYLKRENRYRNAMIILVGDHGEGLGEHGELTHGIFLYDATTHVPLLMKLPASNSAGVVVQQQVQTTDILPTVLDELGITPPAAMARGSLLPYFTSSHEGPRVVFGETDYPLRFGWAPLRAIRQGGLKFIEAPQPELYDLEKDPAEIKNQYEPWNASVKQMRAQLAASPMKAPRVSASTGAASAQTLSELRALGYVGPGDEQTSTNVPELSSLPDPKDKIEEQNLLHSAMMSAAQGDSSEARTLLQKVLDRNPDSPSALRQLGELELKAGEYGKAAGHLEGARKARPDDAMAALYEGQALERSGDVEAARKVLEEAVTRSPAQKDARLLLAQLELKSGDRGAAEDQFEAILLLDPGNEDAVLGLANEYLAGGRAAEALGLLEPHAKDAPAHVELLRVLIQAYTKLGRTDDASRVQEQVKRMRRR